MSQTDTPPGESTTTDDAKAKAQEAAGQAQEKAQEAAGKAKSQVHAQVEQRSTQAGEQLGGHASDIRSVGEELRKQGNDGPAKLAEQAADHAERFSGYLKDSDSDKLLRDLENLGRKQPWAVVLGGMAVGFAASRFLKASSSERYRESSSGNGASPQRTLPEARQPYESGVYESPTPPGPAPLAPGSATGAPPGTAPRGPGL